MMTVVVVVVVIVVVVLLLRQINRCTMVPRAAMAA